MNESGGIMPMIRDCFLFAMLNGQSVVVEENSEKRRDLQRTMKMAQWIIWFFRKMFLCFFIVKN
jgi:hypothetical protein